MDIGYGDALIALTLVILRDFLPWVWEMYRDWKQEQEPGWEEFSLRDGLQLHRQYKKHLDAAEYDALRALFDREIERLELFLGVRDDAPDESSDDLS